MLVIVESDPTTSKGKGLKLCETLLRTGAKFYTPLELKEKVERCGYFLTATKDT
jgi:hypothetical protein